MLRLVPSRANTCLKSLLLSRSASSHAPTAHFDRKEAYPQIGGREVVGLGIQGYPLYTDVPDVPFPPLRWAETTQETAALKNKDWKSLTVDEKKALYRASFCQTYAEMEAPSGEWKYTLGIILAVTGLTLWFYKMVMQNIVYNFPKPVTYTPEHQAGMLERMIAEGQGRVEGAASNWDYEKGDWKWNVGKK